MFSKLKIFNRNRYNYADLCFVVHNNYIININDNKHLKLDNQDYKSEDLAKATRHLLSGKNNKQRIALCLPASEFVVTTVTLPGVSPENLANATRLQTITLLPGLTEPPLLAIYANKHHKNKANNNSHLAIWLPIKRAESLFKAFQQYNIHLDYILVRPLLASSGTVNQQIHDNDSQALTYLHCEHDTLQQWSYVTKQDYENDDFRKQFDDSKFVDNVKTINKRNNISDWEKNKKFTKIAYNYAFIPPSTQQHLFDKKRKRKNRLISSMLILFLMCIFMVIGASLYHKKSLKDELKNLTLKTTNVSKIRTEVFNLEDKIAAISNFPSQNVSNVLAKLNSMIPKNSWIVSFKVKEGIIEFQGYSPEPTSILESLTKEPDFIDVEFNEKTRIKDKNGVDRFGIKFHLNNINVENYVKDYIVLEEDY
jgi:hypothetical protein